MSDELEAMRDERNHWIGEAKKFERLYRSSAEDATRWFKQRNEARAELAALQAASEGETNP